MMLFAVAFATVADGLGNPFVVPASFFFGAAAGPVAMLVATHDRIGIGTSAPTMTLVNTGLFGGGVALLIGSVWDELVIGHADAPAIVWVGFIEEPAKLVPVVAIALTGRHLSKRAGIALGMAVATGFAILESVAYAYSTLQHGNVFEGDETLLVRGLVGPFGHLVWTGTVCAVAFAAWQRRGKVVVTPAIIGVLLLVCVLHSAYDALQTLDGIPYAVHFLYLAVALVSYWIFRLFTRDLTLPPEAPSEEAGVNATGH
jgi:RsiW-degrading membrane proteinase PrsW (M82 family)